VIGISSELLGSDESNELVESTESVVSMEIMKVEAKLEKSDELELYATLEETPASVHDISPTEKTPVVESATVGKMSASVEGKPVPVEKDAPVEGKLLTVKLDSEEMVMVSDEI